MESLRLIDDVVKLEQNPSEIMEEDKGSGSSLNSQSYNSTMKMLRENLKVVKLHNMLQMQLLLDKMKNEHETKLIEEPLIETYRKDYEFCQCRVREMKQKHKESKLEDDEDYPENSRKNLSDKRKKNPPRRMRNSRRKRGSIGLDDYNLEESYDDSEKWNM